MVNNDYGKLAYLKVAQLENKINDLDSKVSENETAKLEFLFNDLISKQKHYHYALFNVLKEGAVQITVEIDADINVATYLVEVKVNGESLHTQSVIDKNKYTIFLEPILSATENVIDVTVQHQDMFVKVNSIKITVKGNVEKVNYKNFISNLTVDNVEYVLRLKKDFVELFTYSHDSYLVCCYTLKNVCDCKIVGAINGEIYLAYIDQNNKLFMCTYNAETGADEIVDLKVSGCRSVAGYPYENGIKLFYSKFAKIFSGIYVKNANFYGEYTGRKGTFLYGDANVPNAIIIVDNFYNAKFITE